MDNVGLLMHKLTKYQTLYAHGTDKQKKKVYGQKVEYYTQKLSDLGISKNNLHKLNKLSGGTKKDASGNEIPEGEVKEGSTEAVTNPVVVEPVAEEPVVEKDVTKQIEDTIKEIKSRMDTKVQQEKIDTEVNKVAAEIRSVSSSYGNVKQYAIGLIKSLQQKLSTVAKNISTLDSEVQQLDVATKLDDIKKATAELKELITRENFESELETKQNKI
jgi:cation transport regulator ChaC